MRIRIKTKKEHYPTLLTILNAVSGFLAIIFAAKQQFTLSAAIIILAFIFDVLDGILARKLGVANDFGMELDSLADAISFVTAPAALLYFNYFANTSYGLILASLIIAFGIIRLAKFNISGTTKHFTGMPTPLFAAATIAFTLGNINIGKEITAIIFAALAYMMISPVKYPSFKEKGMPKYKHYALTTIAFLLAISILKININKILMIEYAIIAIITALMLFDKHFTTKKPIIAFVTGIIITAAISYTNKNFLLVLPIIYSAIAAPLIQMPLNPKKAR